MFEHGFLPLINDHSFKDPSPSKTIGYVTNNAMLAFPQEKISHYTTALAPPPAGVHGAGGDLRACSRPPRSLWKFRIIVQSGAFLVYVLITHISLDRSFANFDILIYLYIDRDGETSDVRSYSKIWCAAGFCVRTATLFDLH